VSLFLNLNKLSQPHVCYPNADFWLHQRPDQHCKYWQKACDPRIPAIQGSFKMVCSFGMWIVVSCCVLIVMYFSQRQLCEDYIEAEAEAQARKAMENASTQARTHGCSSNKKLDGGPQKALALWTFVNAQMLRFQKYPADKRTE
jgi:hypothetical protein